MFYDYSLIINQYFTCSGNGNSDNYSLAPIIYPTETKVIIRQPTSIEIERIVETLNIDITILIPAAVSIK